MNYVVREFDPITYDKDLEILSESNFPLFCGVTQKDISEDIIAKSCWVISKNSGVIFLKKLIPLEILYKNGHDAGSVGELWEKHHKSFAKFVMEFSPKNIVEIGGGHGKLALECFKINQNISYTIIEPNSNFKYPNISYIDDFFSPKFLDKQNFDCIIHSHTFEHIYEPHLFLEQINSVMWGDYAFFFAKYAKMA